MFGGFEDLKAIGINLLSNAISFAFGLTLGLVVTSSRKLFRPSFWSKMRSSKVIIVVGAHATFDEYEASGLIGTGDALALAEFISYFKQSGFKNYEVVSSRTISTTMLGENLILIGGPDANTTSRDFIERSRDRLRTQFGDPDKSEISFKLSGITFMPELGDTLKDAAAIVYQRNPY
ncbi:MAG: hypothetical protein MRY64_10910, partial [Hyphomonadaceae bacterium]|nr:hypothetical protein [Hyphomonadaceae bacterium]